MAKKKAAKDPGSKAGVKVSPNRLWWILVLAPFIGLGVLLTIAAASKDLPSTTELQNPRSDLATAVLFSDGSIMGQYLSLIYISEPTRPY